MTERFAKMDISLNVHTGVQMSDHRLSYTDDPAIKRLWSCCYGHLDNLQHFYSTGKKYGFTSEDDVHIPLGYMTEHPIKDWYSGYHFVYPYDPEREYQYHHYPNHQWGIHLAMFSREYASRALDAFAYGYAKRTLTENNIAPFNPDWTITKLTDKRALMYPMMAVEDGKGNYDHWGQGEFHRNSNRANYIPDMFY